MSNSGLSRNAQRGILCVGLLAVYLAALVALDFLRFPVQRDELHFWPTSLLFSHSVLPGLELLRSYPELNTPLPFVLFGWLEHAFHGGIVVGRAFNLVLSLAVVLGVGLADERGDWSGVRAALGLLLFPYYLGVSAHLYTDVIAAAFVVAGMALHLRGRYVLAALAFVLALSARQYMVAFPIALLAQEGLRVLRGGRWADPAWVMPLLASLSLLGWIVFFGGLAPVVEAQRQQVGAASLLSVYPSHALYFLATIGLYFVLPEWLLFRRQLPFRGLLTMRSVICAGVLLGLFVLFPPLRNEGAIPTMGFLDKVLVRLVPDLPRVALYYLLALVATLRLLRWDLAGLLLLANAAVMLKAHIAWGKYALALLVVLWLLRSAHRMSDGAQAVREQ